MAELDRLLLSRRSHGLMTSEISDSAF